LDSQQALLSVKEAPEVRDANYGSTLYSVKDKASRVLQAITNYESVKLATYPAPPRKFYNGYMNS